MNELAERNRELEALRGPESSDTIRVGARVTLKLLADDELVARCVFDALFFESKTDDALGADFFWFFRSFGFII